MERDDHKNAGNEKQNERRDEKRNEQQNGKWKEQQKEKRNGKWNTNDDINSDNRRQKRRTFIAAGATAAAIALLKISTGQQVNVQVPLIGDPTKKPGMPPGTLGTRSGFEVLSKRPTDGSSRSPLQNLHGIITPSDLHFERNHGGVPLIDPDKYELTIHGLVDKPMVFKLHDIKRFPAVSRIAFIECSGNFRTGKETMTVQEICGLTSQSEWTGVMLSTLFREVGVKPNATWFLAEGCAAAISG